MMNGEQRIKEIVAKLQADEFEISQAKVGVHDCIIAYKKEFKWSLLAVQANNFFIIAKADNVNAQILQRFSSQAMQYGIDNHTGWPRMLQSAIITFPIMVSDNIMPDAIKWVQQSPTKHVAAFENPIALDGVSGEHYYFTGTPLWGALFYGYLRKLIKKFVG